MRLCARTGRAGNLVLLGDVPVFDAGLAERRQDGRTRLRHRAADLGAGHRLRHHLLLGRAHDHDDRPVGRPRAVPRRLHHRPGPRQGRPEDVEVKGNILDPLDIIDGIGIDELVEAHARADAAEDGREDRRPPQGIPGRHQCARRRRAALHHGRAGRPRPRHQVRPRPRRGLQELLQQAVERDALRADERRRFFPSPPPGEGARRADEGSDTNTASNPNLTPTPLPRGEGLWIENRRREVDPRATGPHLRRSRRALRQLPLRPARADAVRIRLEPVLRLVRGTGQSPRSTATMPRPRTAPATRCCMCSTRCCACCTR